MLDTQEPIINPDVLDAARSSLAKISQVKHQRHEEKLADYLNVGCALSSVRKFFPSTRRYGEYIQSELPSAAILNPSLRTHCKWLYEALNVKGAEGRDLLNVLGVADLADYYTANPTVIQRDYWKRQNERGIFRHV